MVTDRPATQASRSASSRSCTLRSAIGATFSSSGHRCPTCSTPASSAAKHFGSRCTSVNEGASNSSAVGVGSDRATANSCAAHSLTSANTSGRDARRSALIAPGEPAGRSTDAGRDAANSAIPRARSAVCRAISRSAACTAPNGPDAQPTPGRAPAVDCMR